MICIKATQLDLNWGQCGLCLILQNLRPQWHPSLREHENGGEVCIGFFLCIKLYHRVHYEQSYTMVSSDIILTNTCSTGRETHRIFSGVLSC